MVAGMAECLHPAHVKHQSQILQNGSRSAKPRVGKSNGNAPPIGLELEPQSQSLYCTPESVVSETAAAVPAHPR